MRRILKVGLLAVSLFALGCVSVSDRLARKAKAAGNSSSRMELSGRVHDLDECVKRIIKGRSDCRLVDVVYPVVENCPFVYVCTSSGNMVVDCAFETGDNAFAVIELSSDTQGILRACKLQEGVREAYKQKVKLHKLGFYNDSVSKQQREEVNKANKSRNTAIENGMIRLARIILGRRCNGYDTW